MTSELISEIANISLALSLLVGLVFGIAQVKVATRDRRERLTLETLRAFQSRDFAELIIFVISDSMPKTQDDVGKLPPEKRAMFIEFGQKMESLGILVSDGLIDVDLVEKTLGSFVSSSWERYKPIVSSVRERDPFLNEYFEWLADQVNKRMKENPREPAYKNLSLKK